MNLSFSLFGAFNWCRYLHPLIVGCLNIKEKVSSSCMVYTRTAMVAFLEMTCMYKYKFPCLSSFCFICTSMFQNMPHNLIL